MTSSVAMGAEGTVNCGLTRLPYECVSGEVAQFLRENRIRMNEKPEVVQPAVEAHIESFHQANGITYFVIKVSQENGACWCVDKQFGEFQALRSSLEFEGIYHPELNKNYSKKNPADAVREISIDLGMFLHCLLRYAHNLLVRQFLQIDQPVWTNPFMEPKAKQQESHVETKVSELSYTNRARYTAAPLEPFNLRDAERGLDAMATRSTLQPHLSRLSDDDANRPMSAAERIRHARAGVRESAAPVCEKPCEEPFEQIFNESLGEASDEAGTPELYGERASGFMCVAEDVPTYLQPSPRRPVSPVRHIAAAPTKPSLFMENDPLGLCKSISREHVSSRHASPFPAARHISPLRYAPARHLSPERHRGMSPTRHLSPERHRGMSPTRGMPVARLQEVAPVPLCDPWQHLYNPDGANRCLSPERAGHPALSVSKASWQTSDEPHAQWQHSKGLY